MPEPKFYFTPDYDEKGNLIVIGKEKLAPAKGCIIGKDATLLGGLTNTPAPTVNNGVIVSLDRTSRWTVTGTSYITALELAPGAVIEAAAGKALTATLDGTEIALAPGRYAGKIVLTVQ